MVGVDQGSGEGEGSGSGAGSGAGWGSGERSLALTRLEEAIMWANAGIARRE